MGEIENIVSKYFSVVDRVLSFIPYGRVFEWKEFFFDPAKVAEKSKVTVIVRLKDLYVARGISFVISILTSIIPFLAYLVLSGPAAAMPILFAVAISLVMLIILPLLYLLFACIEFAFAKLLGGKAGFEKHFSASALAGLAAFSVVLPITIAEAVLGMAAVIPFLSCCIAPFSIVFGIASLLISLYALYLRFIAFRKVHKLTDMKAAAVVALPIILVLLAAGVAMALFYGAIVAMIVSGAAGGAGSIASWE